MLTRAALSIAAVKSFRVSVLRNRSKQLYLSAQSMGSSSSHHKEIPLQPDFNREAYNGFWYEVYRTKNIRFESGTDVSDAYSTNADGSIAVHTEEWLPDKKRWRKIDAVAKYVSNSSLLIKFAWFLPSFDYRVLYTDYTNVAAVYSKFKLGLITADCGWVLGRSTSLTPEQEAKVFQVFQEAVGLNKDLFLKTEHGVGPKDS